jgi:hypothetical protein
MSVDTTFKPLGPTTLVVNAAVQLPNSQASGSGAYMFRVRNLAAAVQYFTWGSTSSVTSLTPAAGAPAPNTIGMIPTSVETFEIPGGSWVIASSATGFEFTPGIGS